MSEHKHKIYLTETYFIFVDCTHVAAIPKKRCKRCKCLLRIDNKDKYCAPCYRYMVMSGKIIPTVAQLGLCI